MEQVLSSFLQSSTSPSVHCTYILWEGARVIINFLFLYVALCNLVRYICIMTIALCIMTITICIMTIALRILSVMCCNTDFCIALCITTGTFCYSAILHCIPHYDNRGAAAWVKQITEILAPPSIRCLSVQSTFPRRLGYTCNIFRHDYLM